MDLSDATVGRQFVDVVFAVDQIVVVEAAKQTGSDWPKRFANSHLEIKAQLLAKKS